MVLWVATLAAWWRVLTGGSLNPLAGLDLGPDAHAVAAGGASLVSFMAMEEGLNERNVVAKVLSDPDGRARTDRLLKEAKHAVKEQLDLHRPLVEALRDALLEREELIGEEILEVLRRAEAQAGRVAPLPARSAPQPAGPPPGPTGRVGRSGRGRVGSPVEVS